MNSNSIGAANLPKAAQPALLVDASCGKQMLDVGFTTFYKLVALGHITPIRFSKRLVRYRASQIETLIETTAKNGGAL